MLHKSLSNFPFKRSLITPSWCYWDNVFTEMELNLITHYLSNLELEKGRVGGYEGNEKGIVSDKIRRSDVSFFSCNANTNWIFDRFNNIIQSINDQFYNFDLEGYESIQYSEYKDFEKGEYIFHMDSAFDSSEVLPRKLSLAMLLNDDFDGGEFQINIGTESNSIALETRKNRAIIFPSFLIHRVAPVTRGVRKSLVIWVLGPKFR